jgi:hypothetical protein
MDKWQTESQKIDGGTGRTEPRERSITKSAPKKRMFSISISDPVAEDLADIATAKGISRNAAINEALAMYIDDYYKK